jgi:beta-1,4-glucosyltransferase
MRANSSHLVESTRLADALGEHHAKGERVTVTWVNHFTAQRTSSAVLANFDYVGVDGTLLRWLVGAKARTSADMVVPLLLAGLPTARIVAIGGPSASEEVIGATIAESLHRLCGADSAVVGHIDGYGGLLRGEALARRIDELRGDVVLVGLGAPLQDVVALEAMGSTTAKVVLTCGGFLDQIQVGNYYPAWAYPLRLNWLVRIVREPKRLWRRYTIDAFTAVRTRSRLRRLASLPGWLAAASVTTQDRSA